MRKTKEEPIVILEFKTVVPPILGGFVEGKGSTTPLTYIRTPNLCNYRNGARGLYPQAFKYLQDKRLNLNARINRYLVQHMEARLLASKFLGKCGVLWSQFSDELEAFHLHLVTTVYGEGVGAAGKAKCWMVVIMMVRVIWK